MDEKLMEAFLNACKVSITEKTCLLSLENFGPHTC
jgi:hypothetical protein